MRVAVLAGAVALASVQPAMAQDSVAAQIAELKAENARLAARVEALERQAAAAPTQVQPTAAETTAAAGADAPGPVPERARPTRTPGMDATVGPVRVVELVVPAAPADRPVQGGGIGLELNAASQGSQVSLTVGQSVRATSVRPDQVTATGTAWSVTASAPLDKSGSDTSLATLDSFTDSSTLKARISRLWMTMPNLLTDPEYLGVIQAAVDGCKAKAAGDAAKASACEEADVDEEFIKANAPLRVADYIRLVTQQRRAFGIGVEGSVGYRRYSFVDVATATRDSQERVPWGVKLFATYLPGHGRALVGSVSYQHGFKEGDARIVCPPGAPPATTVCISGPDGRPVRKDKVLLSLEGRRVFDLARSPLQNGVVDRIGVSPQFTYDARNDDFGVDVPIYLVPDAKGNLIGGVRLGYKSTGSDFTAGVFVGTAFDLFRR